MTSLDSLLLVVLLILSQCMDLSAFIGIRLPSIKGCQKGSSHAIGARLHMTSDSSSLLPTVGPGSIVALVTPMKSDNSIDFDKLVELLEWHVEQGTDGAVVLGTTGEASTISFSERSDIISTAVKAVKGAMPIIIGTGCVETSKTIELSQQAKNCGAQASLIITPYYVKPPQRALVQHFLTVADAVSLPMIAYNCPGRTGVDMKPETLGLIAKHKNIIGVKDATGDLDRVKAIRTHCGPEFLIYSGEDDSGCDFVRLGGDGVISVTSNVAPAAMHKMLQASKAGDTAVCDPINAMLMPLHQRLFLESNPIPVKRALQLMGKIGPGIRPPLCALDDALLPQLQEALILGKAI